VGPRIRLNARFRSFTDWGRPCNSSGRSAMCGGIDTWDGSSVSPRWADVCYAYRVGFRAHQLEIANGKAGRHTFPATVTVTEITGSESFVHLHRDNSNWVAVLHGVHEFEPGQELDAVLDPDNVFVFDAGGRLVASPGTAFSSELRSGSREENASEKSP